MPAARSEQRLMGQDEVYLQVIAESGDGSEKKNAAKVLRLLQKGKHWVLVTLLVGNVITNETLPIVLDRSIGGGYAAAISSTVLVIIFGEIVPQSICVRFGLPIGAWMSSFVLMIMWIFCPITWPIAKLLDRLLGEDHGTTYKKAGLKTLVTLHKNMGQSASDRLNEDEVSIISGVLDLKAKSVGSIMTPMNDVFVLSADAVLDEDTIDEIMREGYSRIPIHEPHNKNNFVGMLLVKMLITYDPEDSRKVSDFSLATLPETLPSTSCLDIINFFQEGKSHMVLVSDYPGENYGALGVVTLEDVIEELIGEEIIDESDVFVDVHKAIRRMAPAPTTRARLSSVQKEDAKTEIVDGKDETTDDVSKRGSVSSEYGRSPRTTTLLVRRRSSADNPATDMRPQIQARQYSQGQARLQLRNLGPSNAARQPKLTRINAVKIKPGVGTIPENGPVRPMDERSLSPRSHVVETPPPTSAQGGIGENLVKPGKEASDGVQAVQSGYGSTMRNGTLVRSHTSDDRQFLAIGDSTEQTSLLARVESGEDRPKDDAMNDRPEQHRSTSHDTIGSLRDKTPTSRRRNGEPARSGSITESFVDSGGIKKLVLEMSSSSEDGAENNESTAAQPDPAKACRDGSGSPNIDWAQFKTSSSVQPGQIIDGSTSKREETGEPPNGRTSKKKRQKKKKKSQSNGQNGGRGASQDENTPLLNRSTSK
ncbi:MAG: hypothetical protein Q9162_005600 [Coniocarpon cinnabarinum]